MTCSRSIRKKQLRVSRVAGIGFPLSYLQKFVSKRLHRCFCKSQNANDDNLFSVELSLEMISEVSHLKIRANAQTVPKPLANRYQLLKFSFM